MNNDEEYVRSVWESDLPQDATFGRFDIVDWWGETQWSAAAKFTRERVEQVRQLREEIALVESLSRHSGSPIAHACSGETIGHLHLDVKRFARWNRILGRLEAELTRLTAGMKPEAL